MTKRGELNKLSQTLYFEVYANDSDVERVQIKMPAA